MRYSAKFRKDGREDDSGSASASCDGETALDALAVFADAIGIDDSVELSHLSTDVARDGDQTRVTFQQHLDGLPVMGRGVRLRFNATHLVGIDTSTSSGMAVEAPTLDSTTALARAGVESDPSTYRLVVADPDLVADLESETPFAAWLGPEREGGALVNAATGALHRLKPAHARDVQIWWAEDEPHPDDWTLIVDLDPYYFYGTWPSNTYSTYFYTNDAYTYLSSQFGRDGWDDDPSNACHRMMSVTEYPWGSGPTQAGWVSRLFCSSPMTEAQVLFGYNAICADVVMHARHDSR